MASASLGKAYHQLRSIHLRDGPGFKRLNLELDRNCRSAESQVQSPLSPGDCLEILSTTGNVTGQWSDRNEMKDASVSEVSCGEAPGPGHGAAIRGQKDSGTAAWPVTGPTCPGGPAPSSWTRWMPPNAGTILRPTTKLTRRGNGCALSSPSPCLCTS